ELARAQLAQAEATRDFMTAEAARATALIRKGALSERAYDNAVREEKTAQAAVASALANLAVREKELESAQVVLSLDRTGPSTACCVEILAPVSGRVLRVLTESEQAVQPGTPILELGDPGNLEIVVELLSRDAVRVAEGARATASGWGGAPIAARVERVEPAAVTRVSALGIEEQRVTVILALEGVPADWKQLGHGFRVTARIAIWQQDGVLAIPVGALFRDGQDWASYILRDGRVALRRITLGERNEAFAQVLDGLQAGDQVILHPSDQVADGVRAVAVPGG
ncbi:MAG: HlyD family efflux transporter periplasmic adaptor subunit, partial [Tabrizicola sp.]|uniref:efflux RND transporter periplasmic adaptor subunit n=1 Tax=Tabrizicola sp. TaxID=2005166 RepID=UPI003BB14E16